jgi:hypothetical protein
MHDGEDNNDNDNDYNDEKIVNAGDDHDNDDNFSDCDENADAKMRQLKTVRQGKLQVKSLRMSSTFVTGQLSYVMIVFFFPCRCCWSHRM